MKEGSCANSVYNGITVVIDFSSNPTKIRIFGLRSFGESYIHCLTPFLSLDTQGSK